MAWVVEFYEEFENEFQSMAADVQDEILAKARLLGQFGPQLGRPHVDTLKGSKYENMKELRFDIENEVWRVAFAFDPKRKAVLLTAGDKKGKSEVRFYSKLIKVADARFEQHLSTIIKKEKEDGNSNSKGPGKTAKRTPGKNKGKGR